MDLVFGEDEMVARWAGERFGTVFSPPLRALGVKEAGEIRGALVFNDFNGANIECSVVGDTACWTAPVVSAAFRYAFDQCQCVRLTLRTRRRNKLVRKLIPRLGFRFEGVARRYYGDDDALVFGMLKEECRFL